MSDEKRKQQNDEQTDDNNKDDAQGSLMDKIKQLGQTNVPQAPESNIHVLPILAKLKGTYSYHKK